MLVVSLFNKGLSEVEVRLLAYWLTGVYGKLFAVKAEWSAAFIRLFESEELALLAVK